jgi:YcxB-like protein
MKLAIVLGAVFLLLGILLVATRQRALNVWLTPSVLGAFWIWFGMGGSYQLSAKKQFTKSPALREPRRIEFSDEGVKTDSAMGSSQVSWKSFLRYAESEDTFLLYTSPVVFEIVPKRALQPEQVDELRRLMQAHIGKDVAVAVV